MLLERLRSWLICMLAKETAVRSRYDTITSMSRGGSSLIETAFSACLSRAPGSEVLAAPIRRLWWLLVLHGLYVRLAEAS